MPTPHSSTSSHRALRMLAAARGATVRRSAGLTWLSDVCHALAEAGGLRSAAVALLTPNGAVGRVTRVDAVGDRLVRSAGEGPSEALAAACARRRSVGAPASVSWPSGIEALPIDVAHGGHTLAVPALGARGVVCAVEVGGDLDDDIVVAVHAVAGDLAAILEPGPAETVSDATLAAPTSPDSPDPTRLVTMAEALLAPGLDGRVAMAGDTAAQLARDLAELSAAVRHFRTLADQSPDFVLRVDPAGRYQYANAAFAASTGLDRTAVFGRRLDEIVPAGPSAAKASFAQLYTGALGVARTGQARQMSLAMGLAGGVHVWDVRLIPERADDGTLVSVLLFARDITERERAADAMRGREERVRQVVEHIDEVFWLREAASGALLYMSRAGDVVFGGRDRLQRDPEAWLALVHPEDRARVAEARQTEAEDGYDLEYRILRDGDVRWIRDRAFPVRGDDGVVRRVAGVAGDVTARRTLEQQLRHAQKMEAIGQLAGGVAHDFNNLLAVVQMQTSLLLAGPADRVTLEDGLREVLAATERASNLTRQLLTFSRRHVTQQEQLDLAEVIGGMTKLLRRVLGEDVTLETRFAPALPRVRADRGMVEQVLMNLAVNSRDAMPSGGRLVVSLATVDADAGRVAAHPGVTPGRFVCLTVADSGSGIPAEMLPHVFEPFFTTKEVGKGTGLGLATVFGILQQHHGWVEVESQMNHGATFRAFLPALREGATAQGRVPDDGAPPRGSETILFVEDEPAVRGIVRGALERFGYTVVEAESAVQARDLWPRVRDRVDLLITDVILPGGLSGRDLADLVTADRPNLGVIFITGYGPEFVGVGLQPGRRLLQKPFAASALARIVRHVIDERARRA